VDTLVAGGGGDFAEGWFNALFNVSSGAISFRPDSSRIAVLIGDAPSNTFGGHDQAQTIAKLNAAGIRVVAVNVGAPGAGLDTAGQASAVVAATGGELVPSDPDAVTNAILEGLKNLDVTVKPEVVSCDSGLSVAFDKGEVTVQSGNSVGYVETIHVADDATQGATLNCTVRFLINGEPAGDAFTETIRVNVNDITPPTVGCDLGPNPDGHVVPAPEAGFRTLTGVDNVDTGVSIFVKDTASAATFGPYPSGTNIKLTQAPGATPSAKPGQGAVNWQIKLKGDAIIEAVDNVGNKATKTCFVPPPPK
jgi:hypothetical protein